MPSFCKKCDANMFICQICGKDVCSAENVVKKVNNKNTCFSCYIKSKTECVKNLQEYADYNKANADIIVAWHKDIGFCIKSIKGINFFNYIKLDYDEKQALYWLKELLENPV